MQTSRFAHIAESRQLLWELVTLEPTVLQCFNIVESTCLSQGIFCKIDGELCSKEFQEFINENYIPFIRTTITAMFTYGFVPFYLKKHPTSKNVIPEIIPHGTFHWVTEVRGNNNKDIIPQQIDDSLLQYRIQLTAPLTIKDSDVYIIPYLSPTLDVSVNSVLYASVVSPLSHILIDYKHLRQAQIRRSHADAWNTTAKMICTFKPAQRVQEDPSASLMDFADDTYLQTAAQIGVPFMPHLSATNYKSRDAQIKQQFEQPSQHVPDVYTLPRDHSIDQQSMLTPCEDMDFLLSKFQRDITSIMGIPYDMIQASTSSSRETVKKTMASGKLFSASMNRICKFLSTVLKKIYSIIYKKDNVEFILIPLPRLEVECVQDLKILHEIGAITPDTSLQLSSILIGEEIGKKRTAMELNNNNNNKDITQINGMSNKEFENVKKDTGSGPEWKKLKQNEKNK